MAKDKRTVTVKHPLHEDRAVEDHPVLDDHKSEGFVVTDVNALSTGDRHVTYEVRMERDSES